MSLKSAGALLCIVSSTGILGLVRYRFGDQPTWVHILLIVLLVGVNVGGRLQGIGRR